MTAPRTTPPHLRGRHRTSERLDDVDVDVDYVDYMVRLP